MGVSVSLEDFNGEELKKLSKNFRPTSFENMQSEKFKLLSYIDPYDDTTFNSLMCKDFINDLEKLRKEESSDKEQIAELLEMAEMCVSEPHTYIKFYGD